MQDVKENEHQEDSGLNWCVPGVWKTILLPRQAISATYLWAPGLEKMERLSLM